MAECIFALNNEGCLEERRERVVRCRDCKFALVSKDSVSCHGSIQAASIAMCAGKLVKPDGFCAWGKERDGE